MQLSTLEGFREVLPPHKIQQIEEELTELVREGTLPSDIFRFVVIKFGDGEQVAIHIQDKEIARIKRKLLA
jgi:hypothetical protein